jgi:hypothetical protein
MYPTKGSNNQNMVESVNPRHLWERTDSIILLFMVILLVNSLPLALKLCADPISMNFVFFACDWSLFTVNQSIILTKSEFHLSIRSSVS